MSPAETDHTIRWGENRPNYTTRVCVCAGNTLSYYAVIYQRHVDGRRIWDVYVVIVACNENTSVLCFCHLLCFLPMCERERQTDRQTDRQTERDRQRERDTFHISITQTSVSNHLEQNLQLSLHRTPKKSSLSSCSHPCKMLRILMSHSLLHIHLL